MLSDVSLIAHRTGTTGFTMKPVSEVFELSQLLLRNGKEQVEECMAFLNVADSATQFGNIANHLIKGHPEKSEIQWAIYRKIGVQDMIEQGRKNKGGVPYVGWSSFLLGSQTHINHQIKMFDQAFRKKPDIGEFIPFVDNLRYDKSGLGYIHHSKNGHVVGKIYYNIRPLMDKGLSEIKNHPDKYSQTTKGMFLKPFVFAFKEKDRNFAEIIFKTMLNVANADVKNGLKNYKQTGDLTSLTNAYQDLSAFYVFGGEALFTKTEYTKYGNKIYKKIKADDETIADISTRYIKIGDINDKIYKIKNKKLTKKEQEIMTQHNYNFYNSISQLIDKKYSDYTIENLYKVAESRGYLELGNKQSIAVA